jgi:hypothetical protein
MYCPECRNEYQDGVDRCPECGVALVESLPEEDEGPEESIDWRDLETILVTSDTALVPVVRSLLEAEGIPCFVQGEALQDLAGIGRLASGANMVFGATKIQVPREYVQNARDLLAASDLSWEPPES